MKSLKGPAVLLAVLCLGFLAFLAYSAPLFPERIATHFNAAGKPDGWMTRSSYLAFTAAFGLGMPLLMVLVAWLARFIPARFVNIPNREHWLSPEHMAETYSHISRFLLSVACLEVLFFTTLHYLTVKANQATPAQLPMGPFTFALVCFLLGITLLMVPFIRHFRNVPLSEVSR